jgi:hypothetical protein
VAANGSRIEIPGLKDLQSDLKGMPKDMQKAFVQDMKAVSNIIVAEARNRVPSKSGTAASGIVSAGTVARGAAVKESRTIRYLRWLDFGTRDPRTGNTRAEGPWRGSGTGPTGGRFLYPAIEDKWDEVREAAGKAVDKAARRAEFK